jgi:hypothetical protein
MPTTASTKRKTQATRRSTTAKKASATRARRSAATNASRASTSVKRSRTHAGQQGDSALAQVELVAAKTANIVQGGVTAWFRGVAGVASIARRAL